MEFVVFSIILGWLDGKREKFLQNPEQTSPDQSCSQYSRYIYSPGLEAHKPDFDDDAADADGDDNKC